MTGTGSGSDSQRWLAANDEYLARSLAWLRLLLARDRSADQAPAVAKPGTPPTGALVVRGPEQATAPAVPVPSSPPPQVVIDVRPERAERRRGWWSGRRNAVVPPAPPPRLDPPAPDPLPCPATDAHDAGTDDRIAAAAQAVREAAAVEPPPALERLAGLFGLTEFERNVLLLCVAAALDTGIGLLLEKAHGTSRPSFGSAMALFDDPDWGALSPEQPLRRWRLVELAGPAQAVTSTPLVVDERIVNAVKGLDHLDERLAALLTPVPHATAALPASQLAVVDGVLTTLVAAGSSARLPIIQLVGARPATRTAVAVAVADAAQRDLYRLSVRQLPPTWAEIDLIARLWYREAVLSRVALFLDDDHDDRPDAERALSSFLGRTGGLLMIGGRDVMPDLDVPNHVVDVAVPTQAEQLDAWRSALGPDNDLDVGPLVGQFDLDVATIRSVVGPSAPADPPPTVADLWDRARTQLRPRLESVAQRVTPLATWDAIVLPDPERSLLRQISAQVALRTTVYGDWGFGERMNRGLGISALFAGESGTGKGMAAEVLANDLRLDLYRIDLSSVVSKYIGETEKNLSKLFDAAEEGGVILFFDEADALFGRRTEVRDAHDRYANIEVNYLLQRMEAYRGLAILATNMRSALDRAFTRRLRFVVTFAFPPPADRARMWQLVFPEGVPRDELDIERLSRIDLTGAGIANSALNAAFLAAAAGRPVGMADVLTAARDELRKQQRPVNEAQFRSAVSS